MLYSKVRDHIRKVGGQIPRYKYDFKQHFKWIGCGINIWEDKANENERWKLIKVCQKQLKRKERRKILQSSHLHI